MDNHLNTKEGESDRFDFSILESIVTTESSDSSMHVAPMGPEVDADMVHWRLKPFQSSKTFSNLFSRHQCIVHVVDDAMLIANAVLGKANNEAAKHIEGVGFALTDACHWYALKVVEWDVSEPRAVAICKVIDQQIQRPFFGWNRARHAVVELAILTSRIHLITYDAMSEEIKRLAIPLKKTAGQKERDAFELLTYHIEESYRIDRGHVELE